MGHRWCSLTLSLVLTAAVEVQEPGTEQDCKVDESPPTEHRQLAVYRRIAGTAIELEQSSVGYRGLAGEVVKLRQVGTDVDILTGRGWGVQMNFCQVSEGFGPQGCSCTSHRWESAGALVEHRPGIHCCLGRRKRHHRHYRSSTVYGGRNSSCSDPVCLADHIALEGHARIFVDRLSGKTSLRLHGLSQKPQEPRIRFEGYRWIAGSMDQWEWSIQCSLARGQMLCSEYRVLARGERSVRSSIGNC